MQNTTVAEIYRAIGEWAPWETAEEWDNVGILAQGPEDEVTGVCCALDITPQTVDWAAAQGCNLMLSHHPVIFHPLKRLERDSAPAALLRHGMTAICAHTNLDKARGGVCEVLAEKIGLHHIRTDGDFLYLGELESPLETEQFARAVGEALCAPVAWVPREKKIRTVGVVSGAGGDFWPQARAAGADCLVTGEMKHHEALEARQAGMAAVAATHYGTEKWIVPELAVRLRQWFPNLPVFAWDCPGKGKEWDPFAYGLD